MTTSTDDAARSADPTAPDTLASGALGPDEALKESSDYLRGTLAHSLNDEITLAIPPSDAKLVKFHGIYMQDDRDLRAERQRQMLEPAYQFMVRLRLPGGLLRADQWLAVDRIAREYASGSLRLTTRQTIQLHGVLRSNLKSTMAALNAVLIDTIAACGDDCRGVVCTVNPALSGLHRELYQLACRTSAHLLPRTGAYREVWLDQPRAVEDADEEPFYGARYLPRKFKIGFALPPSNDVDIYTQDLGFIAIANGERLSGFNVCVGGGMGRTDREPLTYPRVADVIGYVPPGRVLDVAEAVVSIQRDHGDRADRSRARFKYTLDRKGLVWFRQELRARLGFELEPPRPYRFERNTDEVGWQQGSDGMHHLTLFVENGRIDNAGPHRQLDALRAIAALGTPEFRITTNQNLIISRIPHAQRGQVLSLLAQHGASPARHGNLRLASMACVALPTCGLAMAESERYLPSLLPKIEVLMAAHDLAEQAITLRMTGCANGCARPYVAEIALTGRAPGKYNLWLGGGAHGQRLNQLDLENADEATILARLDALLGRYAAERRTGEPFGDFIGRAQIAPRGASSEPHTEDER